MASKYQTYITDLPSEVIENVGQWLPHKSINNFMTSNKYFHGVFNHSTIWKRFLYYPEKYYESDIRSQSSCPLVEGVIAEILSGRVGKWRGYFMIQQIRIVALHATLEPFENIPVSQYRQPQLYDMVDDHGEHWLFIHHRGDGENLCIWNVTAALQPFCTLSLNGTENISCWVLGVLPQRIILIQEPWPSLIIRVYQFEYPDNNINLRYKFVYNMDTILSPNMQQEVQTEGKENRFAYTIVGNIFISSCKSFGALPELQQLTLHMWNLKTGVKTGNIPLGQSTAVVEFLKSVHHPDRINARQEYAKTVIILHPGSTANILIIIFQYGSSKQINIFNLQTKLFTGIDYSEMRFSHYFPTLVSCHVFRNKLCVVTRFIDSDQPWIRNKSILTVFSYKPANYGSQVSNTFPIMPLRSLTGGVGKYASRRFGEFSVMDNIITFKQSKVLVQNNNVVTVISLDTMQETKVMIYSVDPEDPFGEERFLILGFIEPKYMLLYHCSWEQDTEESFSSRVWRGNIKMYDVVKDEEVFTWQGCYLSEGAIRYYNKLQYPSRLAVQFQDQLQIFFK